MDELKSEINMLIARLETRTGLETGDGHEGDADAAGLLHLKQVALALEYDPRRLDRRMARLHRFWMGSVPWCSRLSKELEKVLIIYGDAIER